MKYLTQKQTTKLWGSLALAALVLTALLWFLFNRVTLTTTQAVRQAAQFQQIAPLTQLDEAEVPGFHFLLTGNQDNLVLLGWGDPLRDRWTQSSNPLLSLDLTAGDPALQTASCSVWNDGEEETPERELLVVLGSSDLPQAASACIDAALYDWETYSRSESLWVEMVPLTRRSQGDAVFWLVRDERLEDSHASLHYVVTLLDADGKTLATAEHLNERGTARPIQ